MAQNLNVAGLASESNFFYARFKVCGIFAPAKIWDFFSEQRYIIHYFNQKFMQNSILQVVFFINVKLSENCSLFSLHMFLNIHVLFSFQLFYCQLAK